MSKIAVFTELAPKPRPVYNQAIKANGFVFCSGQLPKDLSGKIVDCTVQDRAHQVIANLKAVLEAAGSGLEHVVEVNVFLSDMNDFSAVNEVYEQYWGNVKPARTCVAVKTLPDNTDVEMKCIAVVDTTRA
ncbi:Endoribonuclease L-PSP [Xylaria arbuscula]|nr:Endoribonuclease L-PSP [Xylaria arbuscula]